jgi:ribosome-associated heat shock protein Hsp15
MTLEPTHEERHRFDKWLWHVRLFKTRSLAAAAITGGRAKVEGERVKPAHALRIGQHVSLTLDERTLEVQVLALPERRGSATLAQACYAETPASAARTALRREQRRLEAMSRPESDHRPDKRERRQLDQLRRRQG